MGRAPCCDKANVKRGPWSPEEDITLRNYIQNNGTGGNWIALPQKAGLKRCGKSCRLRWLNYLRPDIKHGGFTEEEDYIICSIYSSIGSRWSVIASHLQGRTDNDVKNYWNTKLKKKLLTRRVATDNHTSAAANSTPTMTHSQLPAPNALSPCSTDSNHYHHPVSDPQAFFMDHQIHQVPALPSPPEALPYHVEGTSSCGKPPSQEVSSSSASSYLPMDSWAGNEENEFLMNLWFGYPDQVSSATVDLEEHNSELDNYNLINHQQC